MSNAFGSWMGNRGRRGAKRAFRGTFGARTFLCGPGVEGLEGRTLLSAGDLDLTFNGTGKVVNDFGGGAVVLQRPNDKIITAGGVSPSYSVDAAIARHNTDGTLDLTFGTNGHTVTDFGRNTESFTAVAFQSNGSIVAAGISQTAGEFYADWVIAQYTALGQPDPTFGAGTGLVRYNVGTIGYTIVSGMGIQSDGRIVLGGYTTAPDHSYSFALARFNTDGTVDDGSANDSTPGDKFGPNGRVITRLLNQNVGWAVAIQPDDKIVQVGVAYDNATTSRMAIVRYLQDGDRDPGFGNDGVVYKSVRTTQNVGNAVVVQDDDRIVVGGQASNDASGANLGFAVVRLNSDGSLDDGSANDATPGDHFGTATEVDPKS